ncbi:Cell surface A33 antigen [Bagarius yarrelli]|uniref:Cell surface A33 antigen n=1 Tax=Bagarius yarrelli TaxID=175774 RepID=A0A556V5E2_BAGYA|nr:Cell surface A33 antigen [Bagarius yarrelli]
MDTRKLGLLMSVICATLGLQVSIPQATYEVARGDEVTITCNFQPKNPVNRLVVISWSGDPDGSFDDEGITFGTYYSDVNHVDISAMYEGKAHIISDVNKQESKLLLKHVTLRESRRIKCFVQIPGDTEGQTSGLASLVVLVAPSEPVCKIKGTAVYGQNISLTCESEEGSPVPTYQWQSFDVKNVQRPFPPKTIEKDGVLSLFNVSKDTSGYYICTSTNKIHSAKCNLTMSVMPSTMEIGATAGIIGGCVAGVAVLVLIIYCCCRDKQQPEEFAMEPPVIEYHDISKKEKQEDGPRDVRKTSFEGSIDQREAEKGRNNDPNRRFGSEDHQKYPERHDEHRDIYIRGRNEGQREQYDDRKALNNSQQNRYDDHRSEYDDPRDRYDRRNDQQDRYSNQRDRYNDRQYRSNDHIDRYDNRQDRYSDDGRDQYRYDDDRNSFDGCRENYDDRRGRHYNDRYRYGDRQDRYNNYRDGDDVQDQYTDRRDR